MLRYLAVRHAANGIAVGLINQKIGKAWDQRTEGSGLQVLKDFEEAPADKVQKVAREIRADLEQMFEVGPLDCAVREGSRVIAEQWYMPWPMQPISPKTAGGPSRRTNTRKLFPRSGNCFYGCRKSLILNAVVEVLLKHLPRSEAEAVTKVNCSQWPQFRVRPRPESFKAIACNWSCQTTVTLVAKNRGNCE